MRIILVILGCLFVFGTSLLTVKFWGQSQVYTEYKHPMLQKSDVVVEFIKPSYENLEKDLESTPNIYLDVATTLDQKLVAPKKKWPISIKPIRNSNYQEIKEDVFLISDFQQNLKSKKIIFNLLENAAAVHEIFLYNMQQMGFEKGENYIVTSQYEPPIKALKESAPALVYGSTQPEILKIVAMQSMFVLEAANIRADVIIHPLKIRNQNFYNEELLAELNKRYKRIIVGPIAGSEKEEALGLKPFAIIIQE